MSLHETIRVVTRLAEKRVIANYAIAGAVAALNYIQPTLTEDLDVLISTDGFETHTSGLLLLRPREGPCGHGLRRTDGPGPQDRGLAGSISAGGSELDEEALEQAVELDILGPGGPALKARCLRAEHVVAVALKVGRLKDLARIQAFLEQDAVDLKRLKSLLERHKLADAWKSFCMKAAIEDPL